MPSLSIRLASGIALLGALALGGCAASSSGSPSGAAGAAGTSAGTAGGGGSGTGGASSGTGGTGGASSGTGGTGGASSGTGGATAGSGGAGASGGAGGVAGGGLGGAGGAAGGAAGGGAAGNAGVGGALTKTLPSGMSAGCGMAPPTQDKASGFTIHPLMVPACGTGAVTSKCVTADFAPGGKVAQMGGAYDFLHRNYAVRLPTGYNNSTAYPVIFEGGGCGGGPTESGGGASAGEGPGDAIRIGMSYVNMCFADGGNSCAGTEANQPLCVNTPEVPYFYAALADVEAKYCVEKSKVYLGGYSSGGWETYTLGCAAADVIRGIVPDNGGLRHHRPSCTGPVAALMLAGEADSDNPIGPLVMDMAYAPSGLSVAQVNSDIHSLDSNGTLPARDEILARNGCVGTDTAVYDAAYPQCKKYTGCPASTPVVWCTLPGLGHGQNTYMGVNYYGTALMWKFLTTLP